MTTKTPDRYRQREWKALKRREWRDVVKALEVFQQGCAYTPAYPNPLDEFLEMRKDITKALSAKEWGR